MPIGKKIHAALLAGILLLSSVGCGSMANKDELPINVALPDDIVSLDAPNTKDLLSETVNRCIYSTLFTFDEQLVAVPSLAASYQRDSDLEWSFQLHDNAFFHNGTPVTAEDVKFSIERAQQVESVDRQLLMVEKIDVVDAHTVKMTTTIPYTDMPLLLTRVSSSIMSKKAIEKGDYDFNMPIGSGAFQLVSRTPGKIIELKRFDKYFLEPAKSQRLNFVIETSEQARTANLMNKQFDVVFRISSYDCDYLKLNENIRVYEQKSTKMELLSFNPSHPPLDDIRVRKALAHAIDRQNLVNNVMDGYGTPLNSMLPSNIMGAIETDAFAYDPALSKQLLEEAGYAEGFELRMLAFDMMRKKQIEYIKLDLAQVGIQLNYEFLNIKDFLAEIEAGRNAVSVMSWVSNPDPDSTFSQIYSKKGGASVNQTRFTDPHVEELLLEAVGETDQVRRKEIYEEANRLVSEHYMTLPLFQPELLAASSKQIEGIRMNPQGIFGYESIYRVDE